MKTMQECQYKPPSATHTFTLVTPTNHHLALSSIGFVPSLGALHAKLNSSKFLSLLVQIKQQQQQQHHSERGTIFFITNCRGRNGVVRGHEHLRSRSARTYD
ncbi:hypothetical protein Pmani_022300 [Petrolisthes manimaculis]|uniref:Uncharacterized protein n=1 Tax=Petrolisthes manimaculis TaxID=1843537 RepID=A0AAE1PEN2_9EUCA|nr:hypothetical protein Pmani_022300 [Petrolisthes manimaculis]